MHAVFGKDWYYRLFLAFGHIDMEMVNCVNEIAEQRRRAAAEYEDEVEALAPTQGNLSRLGMTTRAARIAGQRRTTRRTRKRGRR